MPTERTHGPRPSASNFKLTLPGVEIELSGDQSAVEDLFRRISHDLAPFLSREEAPSEPSPTAQPAFALAHAGSYTWVYGCTSYYNKVYAVDDSNLVGGPIGRFIDPRRVRRIYVDRDEDDRLLVSLAGDQKTLWAEFTEQGRKRFMR